MPLIRTVSEATHHEIDKIKGSRFIAYVAPATDAEAGQRLLDSVRELHRNASHHCFAWRLSGNDRMRYSDDGEPSGTAGRPILQEIDGRSLVDVAVVVVRYFGGTRLGTGGLVRAYGGAAAEALDRATILERPVVEPVTIRFNYALTGAIQSVLTAFALEPRRSDYGREVTLELEVPVEKASSLRGALTDSTHGGVHFEKQE